ncbi:tetratricopeptide repeat protein [Shimia sp.]|uniref:tetratricopeptide repeat protein n=1 Tax=Shimia sp. TaxID=1954381 RepID=UPI003B8AA95B
MIKDYIAAKWRRVAHKTQNSQSANVVGIGNEVHQTFNVYYGSEEEAKQAISSEAGIPNKPDLSPTVNVGVGGDDGSEEFKLISRYRELATGGDSATALKLLEELKDDPRFLEGFAAFRLRFNIGIVLQNIGQIDKAIAELKHAYTFSSDHPKAKTGKAFADLLAGDDEGAFEQAKELLSESGDHVSLCAAIAFIAAGRLNTKFDVEHYANVDLSDESLVEARLDYVQVVEPENFEEMLQAALAAFPESSRLKATWANSILNDARQNRAFVLGGVTAAGFEDDVKKCATILVEHLEQSLSQNPPNMQLLSAEANNAAVALRLNGNDGVAAELLDRVIALFPDCKSDLGQVRATLLLNQDKEAEAFELISPLTDHADLQVMAAEIEAKRGDLVPALQRINEALGLEMPEGFRKHALAVKARIGIHAADRRAADDAIDELKADFSDEAELVLIQAAYTKAFELNAEAEEIEAMPAVGDEKTAQDQEFLDSVENVEGWEFIDILQASHELFNRGYYRRCCDLLRDRVSYARNSQALELLCDACISGGMATLAKSIGENLSPSVQNSAFGWRFGANAAQLSGEATKALPFARKLFEENSLSLNALQFFVQSLLRVNDKGRVCRVVSDLIDNEMSGSVSEKREYVNLLVFCGEIERARDFAYRLFCMHPKDYRSWMALSSSVLAIGAEPTDENDLWLKSVEEDAAVEVVLATGEKRKYIIEPDNELHSLRQENLAVDHPIAQSLLHLREKDEFDWPVGGEAGKATVVGIKHKALEAFHFVLHRFEEQFPDTDGFMSVKCDPTTEDGVEELMELLRQRAQYAEKKVKEYANGNHPLAFLGVGLGVDQIDAFVSLFRESGTRVKVTTATTEEQNQAQQNLKVARKKGLLLDASSIYLLRRLDLTGVVEEEFGKIGVTQKTVDVFTNRLHSAQTMGGYDEDGSRRAGNMSFRDGRIVMTEMSEAEINERVCLLQSDLEWVSSFCEIIPAIAKEDPPDHIIQFRSTHGGEFFDDLFACDGSERVLLSEDLHLRQWGAGIFDIKGAWLQALLFYFEQNGLLSTEKVVSATIELLQAGEHALTINSYRATIGAEMLASGEIDRDQFEALCSVFGQEGANMTSHIEVAIAFIHNLWRPTAGCSVRQCATGILLRQLVRHQGSVSSVVLDTIQTRIKQRDISAYIVNWRGGHFI